jgi:hypothetical protein
MHNPHRVNLGERKFVGIPLRSALIVGASVILALALLLGAPINLIARLILAAVFALIGIFFAFFKISGETPEHWVLEFFAFRRRVRHRIKGFKKADITPPAPAPKVSKPKVKAAPAPKVVAPPLTPRAPRALSPVLIEIPAALMAALVTVFMIGMLTSLTLYLASGGAAQLDTLVRGL